MYNYTDAMAFINGFSKHGSPVTDLSRFAGLMNLLGNPQDNLKFIHVAGTNGKGSTVRFCAASLISAGYKTGEFTSPFIIDYTDRIRINDVCIPHESVVKYTQVIEKAVGGNRDFSQFEITTAIGFMHFFAEKCDIVCLETGIGGLLDSTNIVKNTLVSIITSISFDHTKILGDTIEKIANQKAGIIKPNSRVVLSADNSDEVTDIVKRQAELKHSDFVMPELDRLIIGECNISGSVFSYKGEEYALRMAGKHQIINAVSAIETMKILNDIGINVSISAIKKGLTEAAVCARAEVISQKPLLMIDGAHNPSGAKSLASLLRDFVKQKPVVLVVGMLAEKNVKQSIGELSNIADYVICVDNFHPGAISANDLAEIFNQNGSNAVTETDIQTAVKKAKELADDSGAVVICGSLYLASEVRKYII